MTADHYDIGYITINIFPDEVLLEIFAFCLYRRGNEEIWQTLVHVCRRWRSIVFGSPLSLNLRIICTDKTYNEALDIWPAFPIIVWMDNFNNGDLEDNLLAAFKHRDRIGEIHVQNVADNGLDELPLVMEDPFPALTVLDLRSAIYFGLELEPPFLPDSFLGGSAPSLRSLYLQAIGYRALPKLLSSAPGLFRLHLVHIPDRCIPLEEMVDSLSSLTRLEQLQLSFDFGPCSDHASRRPPPLTRTVLPVLNSLAFSGAGLFLDHFFARTHFPLLNDVDITFRPPVIFDVSQLSRFIGHTEAYDEAQMRFNDDFVEVTLSSLKGATDGTSLKLTIRCRDSVWQLQFLSRGGPLLFPFVNINYVESSARGDGSGRLWAGNVETQWRTVFQLFTAVENLYLSKGLAEYVIFALQEHADEQGVVTEVLPALQNIFIERLESFKSGLVQGAIGKFVAARELSGRPVTVQHWSRRWKVDG